MSRSYYVEGEAMVLVKGRSDSTIGTLSQLGLCSDSIRIQLDYKHLAIDVDAYGQVPPENQAMGMMARIDMTLVHFDYTVLAACVQEATGGAPAEGQLAHAGALMGNGLARFAPGGAAGNHYIGLYIQSAIGQQPWRFYYTYLANNPLTWPLGAERSLVRLTWLAVPYSADPWNGGAGSYGVVLYDHQLDT